MAMTITTTRQTSQWFHRNGEQARQAFTEQITGPTGGFCNPRVVGVAHGDIEFRCHYDGYAGADDSWTWYIDPTTMRFYS